METVGLGAMRGADDRVLFFHPVHGRGRKSRFWNGVFRRCRVYVRAGLVDLESHARKLLSYRTDRAL